MHENFYHELKVYYEDTDSSGFTNHTSYLKFAERARSQFVRQELKNISEMMLQNTFFFVVKDLNVKFLKPTFLNDELIVNTFFTPCSTQTPSAPASYVWGNNWGPRALKTIIWPHGPNWGPNK